MHDVAQWGLKRTRVGVKEGYAPLVHDGAQWGHVLGLNGATSLGHDVIIDIKSDKRHKECHGYNA